MLDLLSRLMLTGATVFTSLKISCQTLLPANSLRKKAYSVLGPRWYRNPKGNEYVQSNLVTTYLSHTDLFYQESRHRRKISRSNQCCRTHHFVNGCRSRWGCDWAKICCSQPIGLRLYCHPRGRSLSARVRRMRHGPLGLGEGLFDCISLFTSAGLVFQVLTGGLISFFFLGFLNKILKAKAWRTKR
jgi:hypothetical protein